MGIVLCRIDNRLIHGQVLEAWVPHLQADCIVVANDEIAGLSLQRTLMQAAVPKNIRVVIGTIAEVVALFARNELAESRVLLLFSNIADALAARRGGVDFRELNLGNLHVAEGKQRFSCTIALGQADLDSLRVLEEQGVRIVARCIPSDHECDWKRLQAGGS